METEEKQPWRHPMKPLGTGLSAFVIFIPRRGLYWRTRHSWLTASWYSSSGCYPPFWVPRAYSASPWTPNSSTSLQRYLFAPTCSTSLSPSSSWATGRSIYTTAPSPSPTCSLPMLWRHIDWILADHGGGSALGETSKNADAKLSKPKRRNR